jgi:hypothetical protein
MTMQRIRRGVTYALAVSGIAFLGLLAHAGYVSAADAGGSRKCMPSQCGDPPQECILCNGVGSNCNYHANCQ